MEYRFDSTEVEAMFGKLRSIQSALNGIETHIQNNTELDIACACSFVSKITNNQKTFYALSSDEVDKTPMSLEKTDWRSIFIMNPPPTEELSYVICQLEKYIGKVSKTEYLWAVREQRVILFIKFKKWHNDSFTRNLRSELLIIQEINKNNHYQKQFVDLNLDFGKYEFNIVLCKRKTTEPSGENTTVASMPTHGTKPPRVIV